MRLAVLLLAALALVVILRPRRPTYPTALLHDEDALPPTDEYVWAMLERTPGFNERMEQGRLEYERGEFVEFEPRGRAN